MMNNYEGSHLSGGDQLASRSLKAPLPAEQQSHRSKAVELHSHSCVELDWSRHYYRPLPGRPGSSSRLAAAAAAAGSLIPPDLC